MTIGDEKVVAWFSVSGCGGPVFVSEDRECIESWIEGRNADQDRRGISECYRSKGPFPLIPHSAYAELAADRDSWRSMATFEGKVSASVLDDLHTTQAQLAELRGKVVGLAEHYDWLFQTEQDDEISGRHIADELRTLAAADGGADGH